MRKAVRDGANVTSSGSQFHTWGPATENVRLLTVKRWTRGWTRQSLKEDRSPRQLGRSATWKVDNVGERARLVWTYCSHSTWLSTKPLPAHHFVLLSWYSARSAPFSTPLTWLACDRLHSGVCWQNAEDCMCMMSSLCIVCLLVCSYAGQCCACRFRCVTTCHTPWRCTTSWALMRMVVVEKWSLEILLVCRAKLSTPSLTRFSSSLVTAGASAGVHSFILFDDCRISACISQSVSTLRWMSTWCSKKVAPKIFSSIFSNCMYFKAKFYLGLQYLHI